MKVFGLVGWSGSGKTTLMKSLIPELTGRGFRISTIKHTHHNFDIDRPGKDSYEHRQAGAHEVLITGSKRWAILHENRNTPEPDMEALIARLEDVDIVLVEGFKTHRHAKMEVFRPAVGKPLLANEDDTIVAVASDGETGVDRCPVLDINDVGALADFILDHCGFERRATDGAA